MATHTTPRQDNRHKSRSGASEPEVFHRFTRQVWTVVGIVVLTVVFLYLLRSATAIFFLLFGGILMGIFLYSLSHFVSEHTPISEKWSLALVGLALVGLVAGGSWLVGPQLVDQFDKFAQSVPQSFQQLVQRTEQYPWVQQLLSQVSQVSDSFNQPDVLSRITGIFSKTFGVLANFVIVLALGFYLAADPHLYQRGILRLVPPNRRERAAEVMGAVGYTLQQWLKGQLISMSVVGTLTTLGLWLIGVPFALPLGLIAALLESIPNFGPALAAAPAILGALSQSTDQALYTMALFAGIQFAESYLITPLVQQHAVDLPPALTITGQVLFGLLWGAVGLLFATPFLAAVMVVIKMLYVEDTLDEPIEVEGTDDIDPPYPRQEQVVKVVSQR